MTLSREQRIERPLQVVISDAEKAYKEASGCVFLDRVDLRVLLDALDEARGELRIGDRVEVVGKYADEWRGEELYLAGVNAYGNGKGELDYCVSPVWPPTPDCGLTDGFGRGEIKRLTPPTGDKS